MGITYYPPVPDEVSEAMVSGLLESGGDLISRAFPHGYLDSPLVWRYRRHLLWEYKWYRLERFRKLGDPAHRAAIIADPKPMALRTFKEEHIPGTIDEKIESILLMASGISAIFDYPHVVYDAEGWSYRLGVSVDGRSPRIGFLRRILHTDSFLAKKGEYYGDQWAVSEEGLSVYTDGGITVDAAFLPVFTYVFEQLKASGYDWDFGSWGFVMMDMVCRKKQLDMEAEDECADLEDYDPLEAAMGELGLAEAPEDDKPLSEEAANIIQGIKDGDEAKRKLTYYMHRPIVEAYKSVYGRPPRNLPV